MHVLTRVLLHSHWAHLWIQDGTCWSIFKCSRWWGSDYAFKAFQHHWGQQLSYVVLILSPRSLRQQYFNFRKAQGQGDDGVLINPSRAADLKPTTLLLVESGRGAVTCKRLWNFLSLAEGEKKLGTSFSLPNLSEPWQLSVFFSLSNQFSQQTIDRETNCHWGEPHISLPRCPGSDSRVSENWHTPAMAIWMTKPGYWGSLFSDRPIEDHRS